MSAVWGRVLSWTVVRSAPADFEPPYAVALIACEDGSRVLARGPARSALEVGARVRVRPGPVPEFEA